MRPSGGIPGGVSQMTFSFLLVPIVWLLKSVAYVSVFRVRKIECSYLS
jgi:hypothetical protein